MYLLQETEAQLALSKAEELAKAEMISAIAKEKAAQIEKMAEADLNVSKDEMVYFISNYPIVPTSWYRNIAQTVSKS